MHPSTQTGPPHTSTSCRRLSAQALPLTPIVWQVIDDQTSDSPKSWAKTLKDTIVGTLLDHEIFKKGSNKICAKIFCAGPEAQVNVLVCSCFLPLSFILHSNFTKLSSTLSVFIAAGPSTKLCAWGEEDSGGQKVRNIDNGIIVVLCDSSLRGLACS
jgi:hypothetical protein